VSETVPATATRRPWPTRSAVLGRGPLAALAASLLLSSAPALASGPPNEHEQARFMWAMAGQESGWDYYARNASSGAFGKYQIMPFNWPVWASQYLGDSKADQTPANQERVAHGKIHDLYRWLGSWKRVAYWWLTGRTDRREKQWSSYARGYVSNIMGLRRQAPRDAGVPSAGTSSRGKPGEWRRSASGRAACRRWRSRVRSATTGPAAVPSTWR